MFCLCMPLTACGNSNVQEFIPPTTPPVPETPAVIATPTPVIEEVVDVALPTPALDELLPSPSQEEVLPLAAQTEPDISPVQTQSVVLSDEQVSNMLLRKIEDQSFYVTLDGFGGVYFNTIAPQTGEDDVSFMLTDANNRLVYYFPDTSENNKLQGVKFNSIDTITFKDMDSDGRADVSVIMTYEYPNGTTYSSCRIYSQKNGGTAFVMNKYSPDMSAYIIRQGYCSDYESLLQGVSAYFEYRQTLSEAEKTVSESGDPVSQNMSEMANIPVDEAFTRYFNEVLDNVMPGAAGCSLRGAFCAYNLLEYFYNTSVSFEYAKTETEKYLQNLTEDRAEVFKQSMMAVDNGRAVLQSKNNKDMLLSIGKPTDNLPFGSGSVPAIDGMMSACGIR